MKNPLDLAIYGILLDELQPRTVIEIGSAHGGSALWFSAQCRARELNTPVFSFDINVPEPLVSDDMVTFSYGDIHSLDASDLPHILETCSRPLLVIEDGPHTQTGSLAALNFFDSHLRQGDMIVVEDGNLKDLGYKSFKNGPNRAIDKFLSTHRAEYEIDRRLCDFFGPNATANVNGYLRRL